MSIIIINANACDKNGKRKTMYEERTRRSE
jgi:hypothetical protein